MKKTVCLIDDDNIYNFIFEKQIRNNELAENIFIYQDGEEALDKLNSIIETGGNMPDIIFLDINMPVMDAWEFLDIYQNLVPKISKPISLYVVSSSVNDIDIERAKSYKVVTNYLVKPLSNESLVSIFTPFPKKV